MSTVSVKYYEIAVLDGFLYDTIRRNVLLPYNIGEILSILENLKTALRGRLTERRFNVIQFVQNLIRNVEDAYWLDPRTKKCFEILRNIISDFGIL